VARAAKAASVPAKPNVPAVNNPPSIVHVERQLLRTSYLAHVAPVVLGEQENAPVTVLRPKTQHQTGISALAVPAQLPPVRVRGPLTAGLTLTRSISPPHDSQLHHFHGTLLRLGEELWRLGLGLCGRLLCSSRFAHSSHGISYTGLTAMFATSSSVEFSSLSGGSSLLSSDRLFGLLCMSVADGIIFWPGLRKSYGL